MLSSVTRDIAGLRIIAAAAQRRIGVAAPDRLVVLGVAAARGAVADVDEPAAIAQQHDAAGLLDRLGRARVFLACARVDLALLRRAQQERIGQVAAADLLQQLGARGDRLGLERGGRRIGIHLGGHEPGEQLVLGHRVRREQRAVVIERDVDRAPVAAVFGAGLELRAAGAGRHVGDRQGLGRPASA